ncbi:MAG: outer membrane beta-barrel protein [Saprospiraceae bacterium]|nr:PorT family protein [Bacteroidia bacterium]NNE16019.1 outer membrane beta-barrel protein [Saprospiraceae bacterium]NNL90718.1 outer membrane beta-barrel protein [Saprospiraceae bacterium]
MKKPILLIVTILCFSLSISAQVNFYIASGVNLSNISQEINNEKISGLSNGSLVSPFLSIGAATPILDKLYLFGEISYSPQGYQNDVFPPDGPPTAQKTKYDYLNVMPGLAYQINPVRFEIGGFVGYSLSEKIKFMDGWSEDLDFIDELNVGAFAGINIILFKELSIFSRYYYGLASVLELNITDFDGNPAGIYAEKTRTLQVGLSFGLD